MELLVAAVDVLLTTFIVVVNALYNFFDSFPSFLSIFFVGFCLCDYVLVKNNEFLFCVKHLTLLFLVLPTLRLSFIKFLD